MPLNSTFSFISLSAPLQAYVMLREKVTANPKSNKAAIAPMLKNTYHMPSILASKK